MTITSYPSINSVYYKNIVDDLADKMDIDLVFDELLDFITPEQVVAFIEHLRVVGDIEDLIPADYPTSEQMEEVKANAHS